MKHLFSTYILAAALSCYGQTGGENTFQFLDLDFSARSLSLGGDFIPLRDGDIHLAVTNPASITEKMHRNISLDHFIHPGGINYGQLAFANNFEGIGTFTSHVRYVNYGRFARTDQTGVQSGNFTAGDYAVGIGYAKTLNKLFSIGANFNTIISHYESYSSWGVSADVAAMLRDEKSNITATVLARNVGYQIKGYTKKNHEPLPIEVLAGISYKFHHAPFRLAVVVTDITTPDLTYNDPNLLPTIDQLTGDTIPVPKASVIQKMAYHTNFSLELVPNDNIYIRAGFNYQRRNALGIVDRMGAGGFSFGFGVKVKKFSFDYGLAFHSIFAQHVFGIKVNFEEWVKKQ